METNPQKKVNLLNTFRGIQDEEMQSPENAYAGPKSLGTEMGEIGSALYKGGEKAIQDFGSGVSQIGSAIGKGVDSALTSVGNTLDSGIKSTGEFLKNNPDFLMGATPVLMGFLTGDYEDGFGIASKTLLGEAERRQKLMDEQTKLKMKKEAEAKSAKPLTKANTMVITDANGNPVISSVEESLGKSPYMEDKFNLNQKKELEKYKAGLKEKSDKGNFKDEQQLRKEYFSNPVSKNTASIAQSFNTLHTLYNSEQTGAGDISMIFSYMKMLDPTSTVREGEQATARNSGAIPSSLQLMYNRLIEGKDQLLPTDVRRNFYLEAQKLYRSQSKVQSQIDESFKNIAKRNKINPENVLNMPKIQTDSVPMGKILKSKKTGKQYIQMPDGSLKEISG